MGVADKIPTKRLRFLKGLRDLMEEHEATFFEWPDGRIAFCGGKLPDDDPFWLQNISPLMFSDLDILRGPGRALGGTEND